MCLAIVLSIVPASVIADCSQLSARNLPLRLGVDEAPVCQSYRNLDGLAEACYWTFKYRTTGADFFAISLTQAIENCGGIMRHADTDVNHPDSFEQAIFDLDNRIFSVSVKDKGALSQTLVFLSVSETSK
ncbi:MAG: hypothetical protein ACPG5U_03465 [Planktomarina sp.]